MCCKIASTQSKDSDVGNYQYYHVQHVINITSNQHRVYKE